MSLAKIANARILAPEGLVEGDVLIDAASGKILAVGVVPDAPLSWTINADGSYVVPGGIDAHVHLGNYAGPPVSDGFAAGTRAALAGGTTTIIDFCEPGHGESGRHCLDRRMAEAVSSHADYLFHFILNEEYENLLGDLPYLESRGIKDFKLFTIYEGETLSLADVERIFDCLGGDPRRTFLVHSEDAGIISKRYAEAGDSGDFTELSRERPAEAEVLIASAIRRLAGETGARACVAHSSAAGTAALLDLPPLERGEFHLETCPHYLAYTAEKLAEPDGALFTMTPPLRTGEDQEALWREVLTGRLDILSTDHCPFSRSLKLGSTYQTVPCGVDGIQSRFEYAFGEGVLSKGLSMERFVRLTSEGAARFYGLYPQKGCIAEGSDADLVILDPEGMTTFGLASAVDDIDYSVWEGVTLPGRISDVVKGGVRVVSDGHISEDLPLGRYLGRPLI